MYVLYQAEWCPYSSYVREQLTERGVAFVARQVPAAKPARWGCGSGRGTTASRSWWPETG